MGSQLCISNMYMFTTNVYQSILLPPLVQTSLSGIFRSTTHGHKVSSHHIKIMNTVVSLLCQGLLHVVGTWGFSTTAVPSLCQQQEPPWFQDHNDYAAPESNWSTIPQAWKWTELNHLPCDWQDLQNWFYRRHVWLNGLCSHFEDWSTINIP